MLVEADENKPMFLTNGQFAPIDHVIKETAPPSMPHSHNHYFSTSGKLDQNACTAI